MSDGFDSDKPLSQAREIITRLQSDISDIETLLPLLCAPLEHIGILPPQLHRYNSAPVLKASGWDTHKHLPVIQRIILDRIVTTWLPALEERRMVALLDQYFCPDIFSSASQAASDTSLHAYSVILSSPLSDFSISQLTRMTKSYPIDRLHATIFAKTSSLEHHKKTIAWEDCVREVVSVPSKVANYAKSAEHIPLELQYGPYLTRLCSRSEILVSQLCDSNCSDCVPSLGVLVLKLVNVGLFPAFKSTSPSQPSFFTTNMLTMRNRFINVSRSTDDSYAMLWQHVFETLPSGALNSTLRSLLYELSGPPRSLDVSAESRGLIKREAHLLVRLFGVLGGEVDDEKWTVVSTVMIADRWNESHARTLVCWASGCNSQEIDQRALGILLSRTIDVWTSPEHIKHSLLSYHRFLTSLLLITISHFPPNSPTLHEIAFSQPFISSIGTYIGHLDTSIRCCGMLVAEVLAQCTGKVLNFGDWESEDEERVWARNLRNLIQGRDVDAEEAAHDIIRLDPETDTETSSNAVDSDNKTEKIGHGQTVQHPIQRTDNGYDSDDSLTGYASDTSSRSPSPTASEYEEIEKDPTLRMGRKKIQKPVYLVDLGTMLRSNAKPDDTQEADRIEVALSSAEELIRRKATYGLELEENAVNLAFALVGLQNNFELDKFDEYRQAGANALVACCPRTAAPAIIEEFFKNQYSTAQRFVMLNALALGARELASLPLPPSSRPVTAASFPSRRLPPALHRRYIMEQGDDDLVQSLLSGISSTAIESSKRAAEDKVGSIVRERQLRIKKPARIYEHTITNNRDSNSLAVSHNKGMVKTTFTEVAAEYFISPLISRFWLFLRDEQSREDRTAYQTAHSYQGTGTGLILSPMVLSHFLGTVAVLMDAARHSPAYLAVIAPDALELAVTIGMRPMSRVETEDNETQAAVLAASFQLALIVLDACLNLDDGRSLALEHTSLLLSTAEWAERVLTLLDQGMRVMGGGGVQGPKLKGAAAGVVLKIDEVTSKWKLSMIGF